MRLSYIINVDESCLLLNISTDKDVFNQNTCSEIKQKYGIELAEIDLERIHGKCILTAGTLNRISTIIAHFLIDNPQYIVYYRCDDQYIQRKECHKLMSNQEYRSILFSKMFDRCVYRLDLDFINYQVVIRNENVGDGQGDAYVNLIAHSSMRDKVITVSIEMEDFAK